MVTVSDKRLSTCSASLVTYYKADLFTASDYSPFGVSIKQWYVDNDTNGYKFGHQGQEKDNEIFGNGNAYSYEYRVNDTRLGRFLSVDPLEKKYAHNSPYAFSENKVISAVELEGLEQVDYRDRRADGVTVGAQVTKTNDPTNSTTPVQGSTRVEANTVNVAGNLNPNPAMGVPTPGPSASVSNVLNAASAGALAPSETAAKVTTATTGNVPVGVTITTNFSVQNQFNQTSLFTSTVGSAPAADLTGANGLITNLITNGGTALGVNSTLANNTSRLLILTNGNAGVNASIAAEITILQASFPNIQFAIASNTLAGSGIRSSGTLGNNQALYIQNPTQNVVNSIGLGTGGTGVWNQKFSSITRPGGTPLLPVPPVFQSGVGLGVQGRP